MEGLVLVFSGALIPGMALMDFGLCPAKRFRSRWVSVVSLLGASEPSYSVAERPSGSIVGDLVGYQSHRDCHAKLIICKSHLEDNDWTIDWDDEAEVPFASRGSLWVAYDDPESIAEKAQYVLDMELGGAMVWSIDMDDFRGNCGDKNILLQKINGYLAFLCETLGQKRGQLSLVRTNEERRSRKLRLADRGFFVLTT
ncbi:unnamed protein product [Timema podura]|uniref:GH18 domain-containing protein n=1 Tax=Timema podura TaxID=61482 RepID=A0ABN7NQ35_TIMPD|nr:unnamed protein product [Timema podura]